MGRRRGSSTARTRARESLGARACARGFRTRAGSGKKIRNWWREMLTPADVVCVFSVVGSIERSSNRCHTPRRACRDRPIPPSSAPSTAEYSARMFAVVDRGTARTPWEFSLGFGSSGATGALFPKNPKQPRCQHPVVRAPARAAPRRIALRSARRCRDASLDPITEFRARPRRNEPARADATRDDRHRLASDADAGVIADLGNARDGNSRMFSKFSFPLPGTEGRGPSRFHGETEN